MTDLQSPDEPSAAGSLLTGEASHTPLMQRDAITYSDIPAQHWLLTHLPPWTHPYARLSRWDRPIGTWLLLLPSWWGIALFSSMAGLQFWGFHIVFLLGALLMRGAGCCWNDICDMEFDRQVERTRGRPLPSGQITRYQAVLWLSIQVMCAALLLFCLPRHAVVLAAFSLLLVAAYPFMKRFTWWPQLFLGIAFNWGLLLASEAVLHRLSFTAIVFYLGGICWTVGYDTIYADQDLEDDALIGIRSTARLFGANQPVLVGGAYAMALWFWAIGGYMARFSLPYALGLVLCALLLFRQLWIWSPGDAERANAADSANFRYSRAAALAAFKSNLWVGICLWVAIFLSHALVIPASG